MLGRLRAATVTLSRSTLRCQLALATATLHRLQFRMEPEKILMSTPNVTASTIEVANILLDIRAESPLTDLPDDKPDESEQKPKRQRIKRKEKKANEPVEKTDIASRKPKQSRKKNAETDGGQVEGQEEAGKPKRVRKRKTATEVDGEDFGETEKKKRRRKTPEEDKVYEIPPVENTLTTTFKGEQTSSSDEDIPSFHLSRRSHRLCMPQLPPPQVLHVHLLLTDLPPRNPSRDGPRPRARTRYAEPRGPSYARQVER